MRHAPWTALTALAALALLAGCTHTRAPARVDGLTIHGGVDPLVGMESYTAGDVLQLAGEAFDAAHHERAAALYARYLEEFPGLAEEPLAQFNLGLSLERAGRFDAAIEAYGAYLSGTTGGDVPQGDDRVTAGIRLAHCAVEASQWKKAGPELEFLLTRVDIVSAERFDLRVLQAFVRAADGDAERGTKDLHKLCRRYRHDRGRTLAGDQGAMAYFYTGEAHRLQAETAPIEHVDDPAQAREELNAKAEQILQAQDAYLQCIRIGSHDWIPRAGLQLGGLYAGFRDDILTAAYPDGVDSAEDRAIYTEIIDEGTLNLLEKTRSVYERVLDKATEVGLHDEYVMRLRAGLREVESEIIGEEPSAEI
jgi:Tetratricopeptide repeat